jgi:tripartite-type tricarboxylate transporter receptor subunit TctC
VLTYAAAQVVNPYIYDNAKYDGVSDFTAIAQLGSGGTLLVVPTRMGARNLNEFVTYLKSRSNDPLSYGSWGVGSGGHLSMKVLLQKTGQHMTHVPYRTMSSAVLDLAAGRLDSAFLPMATARPLLEKGSIRAIAISGPSRHPDLPEVKTMTEQGVPFELAAWYGLFASGKIPSAIAHKLNAEVRRQLTRPELQDKWPRGRMQANGRRSCARETSRRNDPRVAAHRPRARTSRSSA